MPQMEKTFKKSLNELEKKMNLGIVSLSPMTFKRGRWETTVNGVKSILIVYEKHAEKVYVKPKEPHPWQKNWDEDYKPSWFNIYARDDFQQAPHYSLSIMLVVNGDEIQLCAMTSGSGQEHYGLPDSGAEYSLFEALDITLENLDNIILCTED